MKKFKNLQKVISTLPHEAVRCTGVLTVIYQHDSGEIDCQDIYGHVGNFKPEELVGIEVLEKFYGTSDTETIALTQALQIQRLQEKLKVQNAPLPRMRYA